MTIITRDAQDILTSQSEAEIDEDMINLVFRETLLWDQTRQVRGWPWEYEIPEGFGNDAIICLTTEEYEEHSPDWACVS